MQLAISIVVDLGLHKINDERPSRVQLPPQASTRDFQRPHNDMMELEARRAVLGCYYVSAWYVEF